MRGPASTPIGSLAPCHIQPGHLLRWGADFMRPRTVGPASHILAGGDDRTASLADTAWGVRFVVAPQGAPPFLVTYSPVLLPRGAQIFFNSLFNLPASEIWWGCHVRLPQMRWCHPAADHQSRTPCAAQARTSAGGSPACT